jgi:hypothetical protein
VKLWLRPVSANARRQNAFVLYAILKYSLHLMFDGFANDVFNRIDRRGRVIFARFHASPPPLRNILIHEI